MIIISFFSQTSQNGYSEVPVGTFNSQLMDRGAGAYSVVRSASSSPCSCRGVAWAWRPDFTGMVASVHLCWWVGSGSLGQEVPMLLTGNYCFLPWHLLPFSRSTLICCVPALVPLQQCKNKSHLWPKAVVWRSPFCFALQRDHCQWQSHRWVSFLTNSRLFRSLP